MTDTNIQLKHYSQFKNPMTHVYASYLEALTSDVVGNIVSDAFLTENEALARVYHEYFHATYELMATGKDLPGKPKEIIEDYRQELAAAKTEYTQMKSRLETHLRVYEAIQSKDNQRQTYIASLAGRIPGEDRVSFDAFQNEQLARYKKVMSRIILMGKIPQNVKAADAVLPSIIPNFVCADIHLENATRAPGFLKFASPEPV